MSLGAEKRFVEIVSLSCYVDELLREIMHNDDRNVVIRGF